MGDRRAQLTLMRDLRNTLTTLQNEYEASTTAINQQYQRTLGDAFRTINQTQRIRADASYNAFNTTRQALTQERLAIATILNNPRTYSAVNRARLQNYIDRLTTARASATGTSNEMRLVIQALGKQSRRERAQLPPVPAPVVGQMREPEQITQLNQRFNLTTFQFQNIPLQQAQVARHVRASLLRLPRLNAGEAYFIAFDGLVAMNANGEPRPFGFNRASFAGLDPNNTTQPAGLFLSPADMVGANLEARLTAYITAWWGALTQAIDRLMNGEQYQDQQFVLGNQFETFNVVAKKLLPAGQGFVELMKDLSGKLWSPKTHQTCLIDVLKHGIQVYMRGDLKGRLPKLDWPHYSTIYKKIQQEASKRKDANRDISTFVYKPLKPKEVKYIFKAVGYTSPPQVQVWGFGATGLEKASRFPQYKENDLEALHIICHMGHYVWWCGPAHHPSYKKDITPDLFIYHEEEAPKNPDALPLVQDEIEPVDMKGDLSPDTYLFDFETAPRLVDGKQMVYWAGWTQVSRHITFTFPDRKPLLPRRADGMFDPTAVKGEENITEYYGFEAMKSFIHDLKQIAIKQRREFILQVAYIYKERTGQLLTPDSIIYDDNETIYPIFKNPKAREIADKHVGGFKATFLGYNNARFDNYLILGQGGSPYSNKRLIDAHGLIEYQMFGGLIVFRDLYRHLAPASLAKACVAFGIPPHLAKGEAPHEFMREDTIYHKGAVPDAKYWKSKRIPADLEDCEYWDAEKHIRTYAKRDVFATMLVALAYYDAMEQITGGNALSKLTIPSVAWSVFSTGLTHEMAEVGFSINTIKSVEVDTFIRQATLGGRCVKTKSYYLTKQKDLLAEIERTFVRLPVWEERLQKVKDTYEGHPDDLIKEKTQEAFDALLAEEPTLKEEVARRTSLLEQLHMSEDYLEDQDANSLYPTAMAQFKFPVNDAVWAPPETFSTIIDALHKDTYPHIGIVECDITYPNKEDIYFPVMATRGDGVNRYTLEDQHVIRHSTDLAEACKHNGMRITSITRALVWHDQEYIFKNLVEKYYTLRKQYDAEGKEALGAVIKLILNSAYGKLIQRVIDSEKEFYTEADLTTLDQVFRHGNYLGHTDFGDRLLVEQVKKPTDKDIVMPSHLGVSVLAYSRKVMNTAVEAIGGFSSLENTCYYMDTDSMFITATMVKKMRERGLLGKKLGQFKSDLKGVNDGMIVEAIFVAPKLYYLRYVGTTPYGLPVIATTKRSKGTSVEGLKREHFLKMLNGEEMNVENQFQMKRRLDGEEGTGVFNVSLTKTLNREPWKGKCSQPHPDYHSVWLPHGSVV